MHTWVGMSQTPKSERLVVLLAAAQVECDAQEGDRIMPNDQGVIVQHGALRACADQLKTSPRIRLRWTSWPVQAPCTIMLNDCSSSIGSQVSDGVCAMLTGM